MRIIEGLSTGKREGAHRHGGFFRADLVIYKAALERRQYGLVPIFVTNVSYIERMASYERA
jgi:hypothetical protein